MSHIKSQGLDMDNPPIPREKVEKIIARALELEDVGPTLKRDELREIAREVGIAPEALERATDEVLAESESGSLLRPKGSDTAAVLVETLLAVIGGGVATALAGVSPTLGVAVVLLTMVGLASRRDWQSIARLMAQWVVLFGTFAVLASFLGVSALPVSLGALFAGGALMGAGIVWLQERGDEDPEPDEPLLPSTST